MPSPLFRAGSWRRCPPNPGSWILALSLGRLTLAALPYEISTAVNWATAEGWNPGLADDACFAAADPEDFFIGELEGALAATVSCVNYGASFAFLRFYTVRKDLRGRGTDSHMECGHHARRPTRDRARWRAGPAAKLHEVRVRARLCQRPAVG
jgi:hypothetical protein